MTRMLSLVVALTACTAASPEDDGAPTCDGKCDDTATAAPLASCWIVPGPAGDPFFTTDELVCSRGTDAIYDRVVINALGASNTSGGEVLETSAPTTIVRIPRDRGYPLRITAQVVASTSQVNSVLPTSLTVEATLATHDAASAEAPLAWRLPFRVGEVVVDSHVDGGDLSFDYPLDLAPFVDGRGASTIQIRKAASLAFGRQTRLELPSRGGAFAATAGGAAVTLPGFGQFAITAEGVTPVAAPTGATLVQCRTSDGPSPDLRAVHCTLAAPAALATAAATVSVGDAAPVALAAGTDSALGAFPAAAFPLTMKVKATLAPVGAAILDPAVAGRELELAVRVPASGDAVTDGRLALDLWSVTLTCAEELCMVDRDAFVLPVPTRFQWGERVSGDNVVNLGTGAQTTFVFASPAGEHSFTGTQALLVDGNFADKPVRLEAGAYRLDRNGLTPTP